MCSIKNINIEIIEYGILSIMKDLTFSKDKEYHNLINEIKLKIRSSQVKVFSAVNNELIKMYWEIGEKIVLKQSEQKWGDSVVDQVSFDLQLEFPGIKGFSRRSVYRMRQFYAAYKDVQIVPAMLAQLSWTHHMTILDKCKTDEEREFYIKLSVKERLSYRALESKVVKNEFQRYLANQTNFDLTIENETQSLRAINSVKDDYNFDFLLLGEEHSERQLEDEIIHNITKFLSEMGGHFTFVGRQVKVEVGEEDYFVDLLFYHRLLKSLVAIELKAREFEPEFAGKMQFYLSGLDDQVRVEGENPSIGIIICKSKNRTKVEYTLRDQKRPIGVATYNQYDRLEDLPNQIAQFLPSEEEISKRLGGMIKN